MNQQKEPQEETEGGLCTCPASPKLLELLDSIVAEAEASNLGRSGSIESSTCLQHSPWIHWCQHRKRFNFVLLSAHSSTANKEAGAVSWAVRKGRELKLFIDPFQILPNHRLRQFITCSQFLYLSCFQGKSISIYMVLPNKNYFANIGYSKPHREEFLSHSLQK